VICHLEWDPLAGPTHPHMLTLTLVLPIQRGHGGAAGEVVGVAAGDMGVAGAGLHPTGTRGGKTTN